MPEPQKLEKSTIFCKNQKGGPYYVIRDRLLANQIARKPESQSVSAAI